MNAAAQPVRAAHAHHARSRPLRFITCGNVDDGKSTLIGRLLWDTKMVMSDHVAGLYRGNRAQHADNDGLHLPDFSLLLDGLQAEREQGITIDVAYRYFSTATRSYIVADTPGHEQYTGNMATGASTADLAILLVDARAGLQEQTRRHLMITSLMGISHVVLVVNKMDLVAYDQTIFEAIASDFNGLTRKLNFAQTLAIPTSAVQGENVTIPASRSMPWYNGPTLLDALEQADTGEASASGFRLSVQRVARPDESFRGYQGMVSGSAVKVGDAVLVQPSGQRAKVKRLVTFDGDLESADPGQAITITLDRNIDIARGDVISSVDQAPSTVRSVDVSLVVLTAEGLDPAKRYWLKAASGRHRVQVEPRERLDLTHNTWSPAQSFAQNTIGKARIQFEADAVFDSYRDNRETGSFVLIDPDTLNTVAGGMVASLADQPTAGLTSPRSKERVTISLPCDLAELVLNSQLVRSRRDEVDVTGL